MDNPEVITSAERRIRRKNSEKQIKKDEEDAAGKNWAEGWKP